MSLLVHVAQLSLYHNPFSSRQREYSVCNVAEASNCPPPSHHQRCHVSPQGTTTQWLPGSIEARGGAGLPNASVNLILPRPPPLWGWLGVCVRFPKQQLYAQDESSEAEMALLSFWAPLQPSHWMCGVPSWPIPNLSSLSLADYIHRIFVLLSYVARFVYHIEFWNSTFPCKEVRM